MPGKSPFEAEWHESLRAHMMYVYRINDKVTERTLRGVLLQVGFSEDDLREMYVLATAHVDDVGADFIPDPEILALEESNDEPAPFVSIPADSNQAAAGLSQAVDEAVGDDPSGGDSQLEPDSIPDQEEEPPHVVESKPTQISLF
jgi:hypothetical protein